MTDTPTPGSPTAVALGCTCPILDNCHGEGVMLRGHRMFWHSGACPVHDKENEAAD
jgi:hypothetical protein